jgi:hypothetical protein
VDASLLINQFFSPVFVDTTRLKQFSVQNVINKRFFFSEFNKMQPSTSRRQPRFSVPEMSEINSFSMDDIKQMDKEVEEILSSSDDEDNEIDDFLPNDNSDSDSDTTNNKQALSQV